MSDVSQNEYPMPESVGPYRIVDRIGAGGMGVVYRARDERLERWVAVKHIRPGEADMRSRERLRREARTVAGLSHPSIVQVHDIVETAEGDWIVMELVEGGTLKELVDDGGLEMKQVLQLAREIAEGLAEAHAKGVVHRDLKTENVKVTELGHAKILDFGLAKRVWHGQKEESLSVQGAILGTGRAMSPEQALGEEVNHLSDLFSFGTLLFETVTRRPPFVGSSLILTMAQICTEEQPSARDLDHGVPRELSELIDHLLQKDPLQRPQSADEVVEVLQQISARLVSRAVHRDRGSGEPSDTAVAPAIALTPPEMGRSMPAAARLPSRGSGMRPVAMTWSSESTAGIFIKTLVETVLVDSEQLGDRFGDADAYELFSRHDRVARDVLAEHDGLEVHRTEDGFLFLFERPVDAVEFVLAYHQRLEEFAGEVGVDLVARAAIHLSEVFLRENTPEEIHRGAKPFEVEGLAKLVVSRTRALARGGQTLLTQEAHDMTRRALVGHSLAERQLHWRSHGHFLFRGVDETVRVFEVSTERIPAGSRLLETPDAQRMTDGGDSQALRRRPRPRKAFLALAALLPLFLAGVLGRFFMEVSGRGSQSQPPVEMDAAPRRQAKPALAVLGFRNVTGNEEDAWLELALTQLLSTELGGSEGLRLLAAESVRRVTDQDADLLDNETLAPDTLEGIYAELGSDYVILGSYFFLGKEKQQLYVQMKLQETEDGEIVASAGETGIETDLPDLVSRLGKNVRTRLNLDAISGDRAEAVRATMSANNEANRLYFSGKERLRSFDLPGAQADFLEATRLDPGFALAYAALSRVWLMLGYDDKAEESGERAYELARARNLPREDLLWIEGTFFESKGDLERAIDSHTALWRFYPDRVEYGLQVAELQVAAEQGAEALATIGQLRALPPPGRNDPWIDLAEARAAEVIGRYGQVIKAADRAIEKGRPDKNPKLVAEALRLRGRSYSKQKKTIEALADLEEARRLFKEARDQLGLGKTLASIAFLEQGRRNPSYAAALLQEALAIFQETGSRKSIVNAQHGLGLVIQRKGELQAARKILEEAQQVARSLDSREVEIWALDTLAHVLYQLGELARAERMMREVIKASQEINDRQTEAWGKVMLGFTLLSGGKLKEARTLFESLYDMAESFGGQQTALALNGLGAVHFAMDALPEAEDYFERYAEIQSAQGEWGEQAVTESAYASTLLELGRLDEALDKALLIAARFRSSEQPIYEASALRVAAETLRKLGRMDEARAQLDEALALGGQCENPEVRFLVNLTAIRFLADEDPVTAQQQLRPVIGEATRLGLKPVELESLLVLGEIEMRLGSPDATVLGRSRLETLAEDASRWGFELIARRARENLSSAPAAKRVGTATAAGSAR